MIFFFYQCVQASFPKQTKYDSIVSIVAIGVVDPDTAFQVNLDPVRFQGFMTKTGKNTAKMLIFF